MNIDFNEFITNIVNCFVVQYSILFVVQYVFLITGVSIVPEKIYTLQADRNKTKKLILIKMNGRQERLG